MRSLLALLAIAMFAVSVGCDNAPETPAKTPSETPASAEGSGEKKMEDGHDHADDDKGEMKKDGSAEKKGSDAK